MAVVDRINELKTEEIRSKELELKESSFNNNINNNLSSFFSQIEVLKSNLSFIESTCIYIEKYDEALLTSQTINKNDLEVIIIQTNSKINITRSLLLKLTEENDELKKLDEHNLGEIRIRVNLVNTFMRKFINVMKRYHSSQLRYKTDIRKMFISRVKIAKSEISQEEIDSLIQEHDLDNSHNVVKNIILKGTVSDSVSNVCLQSNELSHDILKLEQSIKQLNELFIEMSSIVQQQNELLDEIQFHVKHAEEYIDEGNEIMRDIVSSRKKKVLCCCFFPFL